MICDLGIKMWIFAVDIRVFVYYNSKVSFRGVAQLVARLLWEQDAAGSSPVTPTIYRGFNRT